MHDYTHSAFYAVSSAFINSCFILSSIPFVYTMSIAVPAMEIAALRVDSCASVVLAAAVNPLQWLGNSVLIAYVGCMLGTW